MTSGPATGEAADRGDDREGVDRRARRSVTSRPLVPGQPSAGASAVVMASLPEHLASPTYPPAQYAPPPSVPSPSVPSPYAPESYGSQSYGPQRYDPGSAPAPLRRRSRRSVGDVVRGVVRTGGELSITFGVLILLFVAWQLWWTDVEANREQDRLTQALEDQWQPPTDAPADEAEAGPPVPTGPPPVPQLAAEGEAFGILRIPRFGDDYARPVLGGTSTQTLQEGLGHYSDSALPGQVGNFSLAGHRTTYGAPLSRIDELVPGDAVVIQTVEGYYTYRMTEALIVLPSQVEVVAPVPGQPGVEPTEAMLTLTSCHPRFSARERYIVHAEFESFQPATAGPPAVLAAG